MKTNYTITAVIILAGLSSAAAADYYQDFDSMGTTGTTAPAGWSMRYITGNSLSVDIPTSSDMAFASVLGSSSLAVWNQTSAQISWSQQAANMGASPTASNRLLGTSPSSYRGSILQLSLNNNSGAPVYTVQLTYDMQTMASGVLSGSFEPGAIEELPGYRFYYLDGSTWTRLGDLDLSSSGTASATFNYSTPVANGGTLQFRWFDDNAYAYSPDTMFAIDNVSINIPEPATWSLLAIGALALIPRRRKV